MEATTLFTFLLKAPHHVRTVELFGSWDNFARPYRMHRDQLRGRGHWTGCHQFESIVFDGDRPDWGRPRNGPLKQGGRYWYFYRLDDAEEHCDTAQPTSANCPLLPGQMLNVLDIPVEVVVSLPRTRSVSVDVPFIFEPTMTFNPDDRYKKLYRKPPTKLPRQYASTEELKSDSLPQSPDSTLPNQPSTESFQTSATQISPAFRKTKSVASHTPPRQALCSTPFTGDEEDPLTPSSVSSQSSVSLESPCPVRTFAPAQFVENMIRPPTRPGSDSRSNDSLRSFFTVHSKPSFAGVPATSSRPSPDAPTSSYDTAATTQPQLRSKASRNFARPFYAPPMGLNHMDDSQSPQGQTREPDDGMDFTFTGMAAAYPSPQSDSASSEMASPTFTADTISEAGFDTPQRLSAQFAFEILSQNPLEIYTGQASQSEVDDVERRLSRLQTGDEDHLDALGISSDSTRPMFIRTPSPFLQNPDAAASDLTLKKLPTPRSNVFIFDNDVPASPAVSSQRSPEPDVTSPSLANKIFGELGFLGRAIV